MINFGLGKEESDVVVVDSFILGVGRYHAQIASSSRGGTFRGAQPLSKFLDKL